MHLPLALLSLPFNFLLGKEVERITIASQCAAFDVLSLEFVMIIIRNDLSLHVLVFQSKIRELEDRLREEAHQRKLVQNKTAEVVSKYHQSNCNQSQDFLDISCNVPFLSFSFLFFLFFLSVFFFICCLKYSKTSRLRTWIFPSKPQQVLK